MSLKLGIKLAWINTKKKELTLKLHVGRIKQKQKKIKASNKAE